MAAADNANANETRRRRLDSTPTRIEFLSSWFSIGTVPVEFGEQGRTGRSNAFETAAIADCERTRFFVVCPDTIEDVFIAPAPGGVSLRAASPMMRRDALRSGSTNSACGNFFDRGSPGARDATVGGLRGGGNTTAPTQSSQTQGRTMADKTRPTGAAPHVSLAHLPAVTVTADTNRRVTGAFHGSVGRSQVTGSARVSPGGGGGEGTDGRMGNGGNSDGKTANANGTSSNSIRRATSDSALTAAGKTSPGGIPPLARVGGGNTTSSGDTRGNNNPYSHGGSRTERRPGNAHAKTPRQSDRSDPGKSNRGLLEKQGWNGSFTVDDTHNGARVGYDARVATLERQVSNPRVGNSTLERQVHNPRVVNSRNSSSDSNPYSSSGLTGRLDDGTSSRLNTGTTSRLTAGTTGRLILRPAEKQERSPLDSADRALRTTLPNYAFAKMHLRDGEGFGGVKERTKSLNTSPARQPPESHDSPIWWPSKRATVSVLTSAADKVAGLESPGKGVARSPGARSTNDRSTGNDLKTNPPTAGFATLAGGVNGTTKENQDSFFYVPFANKNQDDFAVGVLDGHGHDGRKVSSFVCRVLKHEMERYFETEEEEESEGTTGRVEGSSTVRSTSVGASAHRNGAYAQSAAQSTSKDRLLAEKSQKLVAALTSAFHVADQKLRATPSGSMDCAESGSTCVVVVKQGDVLVTANVGDSRAVLVLLEAEHTNGNSNQSGFGDARSMSSTAKHIQSSGTSPVTSVDLSHDHKPDREDERVRITKRGGLVVSGVLYRISQIPASSRCFPIQGVNHFSGKLAGTGARGFRQQLRGAAPGVAQHGWVSAKRRVSGEPGVWGLAARKSGRGVRAGNHGPGVGERSRARRQRGHERYPALRGPRQRRGVGPRLVAKRGEYRGCGVCGTRGFRERCFTKGERACVDAPRGFLSSTTVGFGALAFHTKTRETSRGCNLGEGDARLARREHGGVPGRHNRRGGAVALTFLLYINRIASLVSHQSHSISSLSSNSNASLLSHQSQCVAMFSFSCSNPRPSGPPLGPPSPNSASSFAALCAPLVPPRSFRTWRASVSRRTARNHARLTTPRGPLPREATARRRIRSNTKRDFPWRAVRGGDAWYTTGLLRTSSGTVCARDVRYDDVRG